MSPIRVALSMLVLGFFAPLSFSQSVSFDATYPKYIPPSFPLFTKKIEVLGTFTYPAGATPLPAVTIVYKLGSNPQQVVTADYDPVTKKFGKKSGATMVPLSFTAPGSGNVSVSPQAGYIMPPAPIPITVVALPTIVVIP